MKKTILTILLVVFAALRLSACGIGGDRQDEPGEMQIMGVMSQWPWFDSFEQLANRAVHVLQIRVLDERVEWASSFAEHHAPRTIFRIEILEVFYGWTNPGDIMELYQSGGQIDNTKLINHDWVYMQTGDELIIFALHAYERDYMPLVFITPAQSAYRLNPDSNLLQSLCATNPLQITLSDLQNLANASRE